MAQLPKFLYRGDNDFDRSRDIRHSINHGFLQSKLINGNGQRIFREPIWDLVNGHILSKYEHSDFLSFTSEKNAAFRFGLHLHTISDEIIEECTEAFYDNGIGWDFAIFTLATSRLKVVDEPAPGMYEALFLPETRQFKNREFYRIFLLDIVTALKAIGDDTYKLAAEYSGYDNEWLVLPANLKEFNGHRVEYSAFLDMGCISETVKYETNHDLLQTYNTISYD
jgi:hypothetical protein